ncbi:unnamed protein product [Lathyrus oleraceus]
MKRKHRKASIGNACARRRFRSPRRRAHSINVTFAPLQFEQEEELEFDNAFVLFGFQRWTGGFATNVKLLVMNIGESCENSVLLENPNIPRNTLAIISMSL